MHNLILNVIFQRWAGAAGYIRSLLQETFNEKPEHRAKRLEGSSRQRNRQEGREQLLCHEPAAGDLAGEGVLSFPANSLPGGVYLDVRKRVLSGVGRVKMTVEDKKKR